jgi:hypothetical protein
MRKFLVVLSLLLLAVTVSAQVRTGNIYGKITDTEGNPLPGVSVTLAGPQMAPLTTVTTAAGIYRFVSIPPGNQYAVTAELSGFKKAERTGIIVTLGSNVDIPLSMEVGTLEEQVTVVAQTPVVDTKKTTVGANIDKEAMQSLPTARDPWVVMQLAPAIMLDRENVGGNESGQQSSFYTKGDTANNGYTGSNNIWAVDGIDITDPAAQGGSALYYDFDMFEELNITTGGAADVTIQTGGIALNMVTRRGGNKMSLAGRFYLTDGFFQSTNLTQELIDQGVIGTNKIQNIKDYGFNAGGPLVKDKVWWWGAYGVQDIFVYTIYQTQDKTLLNNYNFKLNAQLLPNNRFEALVTAGGKEKFGRNASVAKPEGDHQRGKYYWGSPIIKLQDEHVFGNNLYVSLKYSFNDAGFGWVPMTDEGLLYPRVNDVANSKYVPFKSGTRTSWDSYLASRPRSNYQINANYFNDTFLGMSHEIKLGAEYSHKIAAHHWGVFQDFYIDRNYNNLQLDADNDGTRTVAEMAGWQRIYYFREGRDNGVADQIAGYIQDTIVKGNFTVQLGIRFDNQKGSMGAVDYATVPYDQPAWQMVFGGTSGSPSAVSTAMAEILPGVSANSVKAVDNYQWNTWSPRIGLTWDIRGNGKTVVKLALSQYGDVMGTGYNAASPLGTGGNSRFWWKDGVNGNPADNVVQFGEMYWTYWSGTTADPDNGIYPYGIYRLFTDAGAFTPEAVAALVGGNSSNARRASMYSGYDWDNKTALDYSNITTFFYNNAVKSSTRTREVLLTLEHELLTDFSAQLNFTYRRYDSFDDWWRYYPESIYGETNPELAGLIVDNTTGPWYEQAGTIPSQIQIGGEVGNPDDPPIYYSTGGAAGRPYYLPVADYPTVASSYSMVKKSDAYNTYAGVDLVFNKRLSNKWFLNASFTLQDQRNHWGTTFLDPTNQWMSDGTAYGLWGGGASGKTSVLMYTRWMAKLSALYQLPYGFDISGTINAREGWKIPNYFYLYEYDSPSPSNHWTTAIYTEEVTKDSLPTFYNITLRLEKRINVGQGRLYLMADVFNLLNSAILNRAYDAYYGDAYVTNGVQADDDYWLNTTNRLYNEILNPRIWRFGVRFEF